MSFFDEFTTHKASGWSLDVEPSTERPGAFEARCSLTPDLVSVASTRGHAAWLALSAALDATLRKIGQAWVASCPSCGARTRLTKRPMRPSTCISCGGDLEVRELVGEEAR